MGDFYIKKNKVTYKLDNGKELVDNYNKEKDKEKDLKKNLDQMEETLEFESKYVPYDFSFTTINFNEEFKDRIQYDLNSYIGRLVKNNAKLPNPFVLGINKVSKYKDKWFIYNENGNSEVVEEIKAKPFCGRADFYSDKNKVYLQYMLEEKGQVYKEEFEINPDIVDDDILKEYLK